MAVHLVIDGYNLIGAAEGHGGDIEAGRDRLIESLVIYRRLRRAKVTVVFDGTHSGRLTGGSETRNGVRVLFSRGGQEADAVIKGLVGEGGDGLTVVTSDRDVALYAEARGAVAVSSSEFLGLLDDALYESYKGASPEDDGEDGGNRKKGPSKRPPKDERRKRNRLKKL